MRTRLVGATALIAALATSVATPVAAQLAEPCGAGCTTLLGASSFVFATGVTTFVGRERGGFSTARQAMLTWSAGFAVAAGSGVALGGDGRRQRRAVQGAALGALAGAAVGVALEAGLGEGEPGSRWAATLVGGAAGVVLGGLIGAATLDDAGPGGPSYALSTPTFTVSLPF